MEAGQRIGDAVASPQSTAKPRSTLESSDQVVRKASQDTVAIVLASSHKADHQCLERVAVQA